MRLALAQLNFTVGAFEQTYENIRDTMARARGGRGRPRRLHRVGDDRLSAARPAPPRQLHPREPRAARPCGRADRRGDSASSSGASRPTPRATASRSSTRRRSVIAAASIGMHHKTLLPTYDVFDEDRYFEPGTRMEPFDFKGLRLGCHVCEEVWNDRDFWPKRLYRARPGLRARRPGRRRSSSTSRRARSRSGKGGAPARDGPAGSREEPAPLFYVNQVGGNDELVFDGHSLGFDASGALVLRGRDFEEDFLVYDVDGRRRRRSARGAERSVADGQRLARRGSLQGADARPPRLRAASADSRRWCSACRAASTRR